MTAQSVLAKVCYLMTPSCWDCTASSDSITSFTFVSLWVTCGGKMDNLSV